MNRGYARTLCAHIRRAGSHGEQVRGFPLSAPATISGSALGVSRPASAPRKAPNLLIDMIFWSGKRDSNSRPQPWQGCALPTELFPRRAPAPKKPRRNCRAKPAGVKKNSGALAPAGSLSGSRASRLGEPTRGSPFRRKRCP